LEIRHFTCTAACCTLLSSFDRCGDYQLSDLLSALNLLSTPALKKVGDTKSFSNSFSLEQVSCTWINKDFPSSILSVHTKRVKSPNTRYSNLLDPPVSVLLCCAEISVKKMFNSSKSSKIKGTKKLINRNQILISLGLPSLDSVIGKQKIYFYSSI
jgi:hypothetical protein